MENTPTEAPTSAPAGASVESPVTPSAPSPTEAPAQMPDMHGFTSDELAKIRTFFDNNGGFGGVKEKISRPMSAPVQPQAQPQAQPQEQYQPQMPQQPAYQPPQGSITAQEFLAQQYFQGLSMDPKYQGIAEQISNGDVLKEMASFNIRPLNQDGSINDTMVRRYLDLKAQTVPAKSTSTEPDASNAPTVTYTPVGDKIDSLDQAYKVILEPGNPAAAKAEEFIRTHFNPNSGKTK